MAQLIRRARRRPKAEINVVPYIDVMLVLMVILMITATAITAGVEVDLPSASAPPSEATAENSIIIEINSDGEYHFITSGDRDEIAYALEEAVDLVQTRLQQKPELLILVGGDEGADYGKVVELLSMMNEVAGVEKVSLMTNPAK
ncbi:ExbD/TolR family protein [Kangiella sp. TOML190]|uniref:ExbD/TolR family protein n=1 Tax=Kangiella sp. TOML190 TaxID=2931351 RepID=UPI00203EBF69|nr:ExbD/TolR family protein [Kangiella sp. TOML190]